MLVIGILTALAASTYAFAGDQEQGDDISNQALPRRAVDSAIDPSTMDPTRLSVLAVLKTALASVSLPPAPSMAAVSEPEPDWFANLPEEVKSLLPELYPGGAAGIASGTGSTPPSPSPSASGALAAKSASASNSASPSASTSPTSAPSPPSSSPSASDSNSPLPASNATSSSSSLAPSLSPSLSPLSAPPSPSAPPFLSPPPTSQITLTKTLQHASSAVDLPSSGGPGDANPSEAPAPATSTAAAVAARLAGPAGGDMKGQAAVLWVAVAAGFVLFA